jgi:anti-sigma factor RsiW
VIAHEEFRQLCALATSGCLTSEEQTRLKEHLASCAECRETAREYEKVTRIGVPSLALDFPTESSDVPFAWSEERAYQDFLERLENQNPHRETPGALQATESPRSTIIRISATRPWLPPLNRLLPYAAAIVVVLLTGLLGYRLGTRRIAGPAVGSQRHYEEIATAARAQIAELSTERESLITKNQESEKNFSLL